MQNSLFLAEKYPEFDNLDLACCIIRYTWLSWIHLANIYILWDCLAALSFKLRVKFFRMQSNKVTQDLAFFDFYSQ